MGETNPDNCCLLCTRHHRFVHEGAVEIMPEGPGQFRFTRPDGASVASASAPVDLGPDPVATVRRMAAEDGLDIDSDTMPLWEGEDMDYELFVEWLLAKTRADGKKPAQGPDVGQQSAAAR